MKKAFALILAVLLCAGRLAGCGGSDKKPSGSSRRNPFENLPDRTGQEILVGVILNEVNENTVVIKDYLNNELGPALKMKFDFSEVLKNEDARVSFIENEQLKGAVGIINLDSSAAKSVIETCQKKGLYVHNQKSGFSGENVAADATLGNCGASTTGMETAYKAAMNEILSDGQNHTVIIYACAATGKQAESHFYSTVAVLKAMQEKYGLDYGKTPEAIAESDFVGELATGKSDIKIYYVSGNIRTNIVTALETGDYDVYACVAGYEEEANTIASVERAKNMNIKIIATASIEERTATGFNTKDALGNNVLDYAVINPLTIAYAIDATAIRNAVDGHADFYKDGDSKAQLFVEPWLCSTAEQYAGLAKLDKPGAWVISGEEAKALCVEFNSSASIQDSKDLLQKVSDMEDLISRKAN